MISLSELRRDLRLPKDEDDRLEGIRAEVIALWESATGRPWNLRTGYVESFDPSVRLGADLALSLHPVTSIASVTTRGLNDSAATVIDPTKYFLMGTRTLRRTDSNWGGHITVTYSGGIADARPDIKRALIVQAMFMRDRFSAEKLAIAGQSFEGGAGSFLAADFHPLFERLAKQYARRA